jgi:RNA polymerase sigma-70 factor, ECF subfamily
MSSLAQKQEINISQPSDSQLCADIKGSDSGSYKILFYRYYDPIYYFFWNRTKSQELAKDFVQDVFTKLWQNRVNLNPKLSIKAYLFRMANNLLIDHYRKKQTQTVFQEDNFSYEPSENPFETYDVEEGVNKALSELPENLRTVFTMNRFDGLKYTEIAESLNVSIKTVESRMSKALKILRETLKPFLILIFLFQFVLAGFIHFFTKMVG